MTTAALPVGQLPDAGVAPLSGQTVTSACSDGSGFVLAGTTSASESRAYGAVWTSPDGRRWTKMPVTPNGLSEFNEIFGVACSPDGVLLLGTYTQRDTVLHSWTGRVAP